MKDLPLPVEQVDLYLPGNRKQTEVLKEAGTGYVSFQAVVVCPSCGRWVRREEELVDQKV